jgi:hypothetical protein
MSINKLLPKGTAFEKPGKATEKVVNLSPA